MAVNLAGLIEPHPADSVALISRGRTTTYGELRESAAAMTLLVEEIRDRSLQLRMVPIGDTFNRFQRVVRDLAAELGKDMELSINGADTELDKTVVEKIADPLTHLVRNAVDHGPQSNATPRASPPMAR